MSAPEKVVVFDTETTGLDVEEVRIVSAHVLVMNADRRVFATHDWLIDPVVEIPDAASRIHGITTEQAREHGMAADVAIRQIAGVIGGLMSEGLPLVVFNAPYDLTLLDRELRRHGGEPLSEVTPVIDPLIIDKAIDRYRAGKRTLTAMCATYGIAVSPDAHTASADCLMAGAVAFELLDRLSARPRLDESVPFLDYLHMRQTEWYPEQQAYHKNPRVGWPMQAFEDLGALLTPDAGGAS